MEKKTILIAIVFFLLSGCINEAGRSGKPLITDFTLGTATDEIAEEEEAQEEEITRPDGAVFVKRNYCACLNREPHIINNCESFCSDKSDLQAILYGEAEVADAISKNDDLKNLRGWCTAEIGNLTSPRCRLRLTDGEDIHLLNMVTFEESNRFTVLLNSVALKYDTTYIASIVAEDTNSKSYSNSFQIYRIRPKENYNQGPLKIMPVSKYNCISRSGGFDEFTGNFRAVDALRYHLYFPINRFPNPIPFNNSEFICHDIQLSGPVDRLSYPRLSLVSHHFSIWDGSDGRFFHRPNGSVNSAQVIDCSQQSNLVINQQLQEHLLNEYDIDLTVNLFRPTCPLANFVYSESESNNKQNKIPIGFTMQAFIDEDGLSYCPTQDHYNNSPDPRIRLLKEYISVDTEGLYMAWKAPKTLRILNKEGQSDTEYIDSCQGSPLIIRENLLKKIWFYYKDGRHYKPDRTTAAQETILFYWPADTVHPDIKKSDQETFIVKQSCQEGINPSTDGKIACIPSSGPVD